VFLTAAGLWLVLLTVAGPWFVFLPVAGMWFVFLAFVLGHVSCPRRLSEVPADTGSSGELAVVSGAPYSSSSMISPVAMFTAGATGAAWALAALSAPHWSGWVLFAAAQLLVGLSMGAENAHELGYRQAVTPDALQGRMNATMRSINRAMIVVGAPLGGLLGDSVGFRAMLWIGAAGFLVVSATLALSPFRTARLDGGSASPG